MSTENIASLLDTLVEQIPGRDALVVPRPGSCRAVTFRELHKEVHRLGEGLRHFGFTRKERVLVMVPFDVDFVALTFALFRIGAVPVLIDPGLDRKQVLHGIRNVAPAGLIGVPKAQVACLLYKKAFHSVTKKITVGARWFWGGGSLDAVREAGRDGRVEIVTEPDDPAAILFTSGSTGPPKGVLYTHRMFFHQVELIRSLYGIQTGEVDLPTFPLFGLFGVGLGMTCILPDMDPTRPAKVNPKHITGPIHDHHVTSSFGSPALWDTVTRHCLQHNIRFPSIRRLLIAGAPVPGSLLERFDRILPEEALVATPYGATEALPVCTISRREVVDETWRKTQEGCGTCVGRPVPGMELKIIRITDAPIAEWTPDLEVPSGAPGEIAVRSPWVTREYFQMEEATRLSKIRDGETVWHRMGDVGYLDEHGRLWFCGRKNHRVVTRDETLFTIPCEAIYNRHPKVKRSALVGIGPRGEQEPVIVVELIDPDLGNDDRERTRLFAELMELGGRHPVTQSIRKILFHPSFPVDIRHNAKINRERLAAWAAAHLKP